jgi:hypothetical protein
MTSVRNSIVPWRFNSKSDQHEQEMFGVGNVLGAGGVAPEFL